MNPKTKTTIARLLLSFVLVSIGYALGKEVGLRSAAQAVTPSAPRVERDDAPPATAADRIVVYYFHATVRCVTCNTIERLTHEALEADFADLIRDGTIEWQTRNFHENEALAERYRVASSVVVLSRVRGGQEVQFRRLDRVWELVGEPGAFSDYIRQAVRAMIGEGGE